jgi:hypothetical protein
MSSHGPTCVCKACCDERLAARAENPGVLAALLAKDTRSKTERKASNKAAKADRTWRPRKRRQRRQEAANLATLAIMEKINGDS